MIYIYIWYVCVYIYKVWKIHHLWIMFVLKPHYRGCSMATFDFRRVHNVSMYFGFSQTCRIFQWCPVGKDCGVSMPLIIYPLAVNEGCPSTVGKGPRWFQL
jgi:hypothetical protein